MAAAESVLDIVLAQVADQLNVLLKPMFLYKLLQKFVFIAITSDYEMGVWVKLHNLWDYVDEKVYALSLR